MRRAADCQQYRETTRAYILKPISSLAAGPPQYYDGAINTVGIDVGVSAGNDPGLGRVRADTGLPQGALASILLQPVRPFATNS